MYAKVQLPKPLHPPSHFIGTTASKLFESIHDNYVQFIGCCSCSSCIHEWWSRGQWYVYWFYDLESVPWYHVTSDIYVLSEPQKNYLNWTAPAHSSSLTSRVSQLSKNAYTIHVNDFLNCDWLVSFDNTI